MFTMLWGSGEFNEAGQWTASVRRKSRGQQNLQSVGLGDDGTTTTDNSNPPHPLGIAPSREGSPAHLQKKSLTRIMRADDDKPVCMPRWAAGALAGIAGWTFTYPCDVIRSRMMRDAADASMKTNSPYFMDYAKDIVRKEGTRGLYRGLSYTIGRAVPVAMITLPTYDYVFTFLRGGARYSTD